MLPALSMAPGAECALISLYNPPMLDAGSCTMASAHVSMVRYPLEFMSLNNLQPRRRSVPSRSRYTRSFAMSRV